MYSGVSPCAWDSGGVKRAKDTFRVQVSSWSEQEAVNRDCGKVANEGVITSWRREGYSLFTPQLHPCLKEFRGVEKGKTERDTDTEEEGRGPRKITLIGNKTGK